MQQPIPLISVILDNYNYARFLPDAINSVLTQSFKDYELIVVDDASTDHSREIILSYGDKVKTIFLEKNSGQGAAFNAGFKASRGKLICFLDADDIFFKNKLSVIAKTAAQYPNAVLIHNKGYMIDKNFDKVGGVYPGKTLRGNLRKKILRYSESLLPPTSFLTFRRDFLEKVLPLTPYLSRIDADFPLQMLAGVLGDVIAINQPLCYYRLHGDNWFSNNDFARLNVDAMHNLMRRVEKWFYFINTKFAELDNGIHIDLMRNRFYKRCLFIFNHIGWLDYLSYSLFHPNFINIKDKLDFIILGIRRRWQYNARQA